MVRRRSRESRRARPASPGVVSLFLAVFSPLFLVYLRTLSPTVPFEDGGEMIRAAFTLGVTHPPGYPLYTLLGRLACLLPVGDVAFRMNLLSAAASACACAVAASAAFILFSGRGGRETFMPWFSCALAAWALGLGPAVWWQSVIAEKYALNLLLNSLIVVVLAGMLAAPARAASRFPLLGLVFGISSAHHGMSVYFAPSIVLVFLFLAHPATRARRALLGSSVGGIGGGRWARAAALLVLMALVPLSLKFLFPPIRASQDPAHNWMDPRELNVFLHYLTGGPYQYRLFYWDLPNIFARLKGHLPEFLPGHFSWAGVAMGVAGLAWLLLRRPGQALVWGAAALTGVFYCANFALTGEAIRTYYMPVFLISSLCLARGVLLVLAALARLGPMSARAAVAAGVLWVVALGVGHRFESDRNRHFLAYDFSNNLLRSVKGKCLLVSYEDRDLFPLWYHQDILGRYGDVTLVAVNMKGVRGEPDTKDRVAEVGLVFPREARDLSRRLPVIASLEKTDLGQPVYFTVVTGWVHDFPLLPRGAAYRLIRDRKELEAADVAGEWARYRRWRVLRGVFDEALAKNYSNSSPISYYAYGDYRRGFLLSSLDRCREAVPFLRASLKWPRFKWIGPAAAHTSLAGCLRALGDPAGAEREYLAALETAPSWRPALRALGALYFSQGRRAKASKVFATILKFHPDDAEARHDLATLLAPEEGKTRP